MEGRGPGLTSRPGPGSGRGAEVQPGRFSEVLWEQPRGELGLKTVGELCPPELRWRYPLSDESRRSFVAHLPSPFSTEVRRLLFEQVRDGTKWQQPEGPMGPIPRKTAWMVARGCSCSYRYGRIEVGSQEFPEWMLQLMRLAMPYCGFQQPSEWPNSCNLNLYDDGGMSVGWHSDDERLFQGKARDIRILSLSLGARRRFELRANWPEEGERPLRQLLLDDGDLCTMEGMTQKHYQHRVPKEGNVQGSRINLTWRWVVTHTPRCPALCMRRF